MNVISRARSDKLGQVIGMNTVRVKVKPLVDHGGPQAGATGLFLLGIFENQRVRTVLRPVSPNSRKLLSKVGRESANMWTVLSGIEPKKMFKALTRKRPENGLQPSSGLKCTAPQREMPYGQTKYQKTCQ